MITGYQELQCLIVPVLSIPAEPGENSLGSTRVLPALGVPSLSTQTQPGTSQNSVVEGVFPGLVELGMSPWGGGQGPGMAAASWEVCSSLALPAPLSSHPKMQGNIHLQGGRGCSSDKNTQVVLN